MMSPARTLISTLAGVLLAASAFAAEPPARSAAAKPDARKGEVTAATCLACHTADGSRGVPANPILQVDRCSSFNSEKGPQQCSLCD